MPVAVELSTAELRNEVSRYVEHVLGWQVVVDSPHYRAALMITDHPVPDRRCVCIVKDDAAIANALREGAVEAIVWPRDAQRLASVSSPNPVIRSGRRLVISQSGHQVGASTLALAIGAIYAWAGTKVALAASPEVIKATGMEYPGRILACPNLWLLTPDAGPPDGFGLVVVEAPISPKTQILVGRPDRDLARGAARTPQARRIIAIGEGECRPAEVCHMVGAQRFGHFPWSFRIARAGLRGALPQSFPGRFLADLAQLLGQPLSGGAPGARSGWFKRSKPHPSRHPRMASVDRTPIPSRKSDAQVITTNTGGK